MSSNQLKLEFKTNPSFVLNFKRLNYQPWYAIAEFIDNSLGAYDNNKKVLDAQYKKDKQDREIRISYSHKGDSFEIYDNSMV